MRTNIFSFFLRVSFYYLLFFPLVIIKVLNNIVLKHRALNCFSPLQYLICGPVNKGFAGAIFIVKHKFIP